MKRILSVAVLLVAVLVSPASSPVATVLSNYNLAAMSPVLFIAAHPDDEVLAMSVPIAEHVAAGQDVHVLWLTSGTASAVRSTLNGSGTSSWWGVQHSPVDEGYAPLSAEQFGAARVAEATNAVRMLASGYTGTLTLHVADLQDGTVTAGDAKATILSVADTIAPGAPVRLKGHTWVSQLDLHPDHLAVGQAIRALKVEQPERFSDIRHYILPAYWTDPDLSLVAEVWDTPVDTGIAKRVTRACSSYSAWAPAQGVYAIGYHSVSSMFSTLVGNPRSLMHQ